MAEKPPTQLSPSGTAAASAMVTLFANGRIYIMIVLVASLISITILGALHDIDGQAIIAIFSAIIGGAFGHANGYVQALYNVESRQPSEVDPSLAKRHN